MALNKVILKALIHYNHLRNISKTPVLGSPSPESLEIGGVLFVWLKLF